MDRDLSVKPDAAAAVARGEIREKVDPDRLATVLYSSYFGILYDWVEGPDDVPPFDLAAAYELILDVILPGLHHHGVELIK